MNSERVPEVVYPQPNSATTALRLQSAVAKKGVEPHPGVPKVIGPAIFPLKQPRLRGKRKSGLASCIQPRAQFLGQITTKRNQPGTTFTWPNSKACLLQIEIGDTQTERFPKTQSGAVQDQEQHSHACESQWRASQISYAAQKKLDLLGR
jgi:hypothetical protein